MIKTILIDLLSFLARVGSIFLRVQRMNYLPTKGILTITKSSEDSCTIELGLFSSSLRIWLRNEIG